MNYETCSHTASTPDPICRLRAYGQVPLKWVVFLLEINPKLGRLQQQQERPVRDGKMGEEIGWFCWAVSAEPSRDVYMTKATA